MSGRIPSRCRGLRGAVIVLVTCLSSVTAVALGRVRSPAGEPGERVPALGRDLSDPSRQVRLGAVDALAACELSRAAAAARPSDAAHLTRVERETRQHAELARTERDRDRSRLHGEHEITATIPPDAEHKYPLRLESRVPVPGTALVITLHRGRDRPDRLTVWKREGEQYRRVEVLHGGDQAGVGGFGRVNVFRYRGDMFIHVPLLSVGTGHFREDTIFAVGTDGSLARVAFEPAPEWYESRLEPREGVWKGASYAFADDRLAFEFYIWKDEDANCCPSGGRVQGTYKIVNEGDGLKMTVDTAVREPVPSQ